MRSSCGFPVRRVFPCSRSAGRAATLPIPSTGYYSMDALRAAVRRLVELGHRRIVYICPDTFLHPEPSGHILAFRDELAAAGITVGAYNTPEWEETPEGLAALLDSFFKLTPPTAGCSLARAACERHAGLPRLARTEGSRRHFARHDGTGFVRDLEPAGHGSRVFHETARHRHPPSHPALGRFRRGGKSGARKPAFRFRIPSRQHDRPREEIGPRARRPLKLVLRKSTQPAGRHSGTFPSVLLILSTVMFSRKNLSLAAVAALVALVFVHAAESATAATSVPGTHRALRAGTRRRICRRNDSATDGRDAYEIELSAAKSSCAVTTAWRRRRRFIIT